MKPCSACGETKPLDEYRVRSDNGRTHGRCRQCMRAEANNRHAANPAKHNEYSRRWRAANASKAQVTQWKHRYGIESLEHLADLIVAQGGACAVCRGGIIGSEVLRDKEQVAFHVDHDHATGEVRGVLCRYCNWMLGHAKDDPARLLAGAAYLTTHQQGERSSR